MLNNISFFSLRTDFFWYIILILMKSTSLVIVLLSHKIIAKHFFLRWCKFYFNCWLVSFPTLDSVHSFTAVIMLPELNVANLHSFFFTHFFFFFAISHDHVLLQIKRRENKDNGGIYRTDCRCVKTYRRNRTLAQMKNEHL